MKKEILDCRISNIRQKLILLPKYYWPKIGGLQIATARIGIALADMGWQVSVYFHEEPDHPPNSRIRNSYFEIFPIQGSRQEFWQNIPIALEQYARDSSVLAIGLEYEETIDMQIGALQTLCQAGALTFLRVTTTNDIALRMNNARASILSQLDGLVVLNREMEREAEKYNFSSQFVHRIPVMVDTNRYRPNKVNSIKIRKERGIEQNIPVLIYVGRLDSCKQIELIIEAMTGVEALLWIVGDPTIGSDIKETERYIQLARRCRLYSIRMEPQVPDAEVPELLQAADIFVTASAREGMSNAVLEASSVGLTVAGFSIPGVKEIAEALDWAGFFLADSNSGYLGLRKAIQNALKYSTRNWRISREDNLLAFSPRKVGISWNLFLSGKC